MSPRPRLLWIALLVAGFAGSCGNLRNPNHPLPPGACATNGTDAGLPEEDASVSRPARLTDGGHPDTDGGTVGKRAILVSVDGLGAYYLATQLAAGKLPHFAALRRLGASTLNARADYDYTVTLPNHTSMLTGRPVWADEALPETTHHGWTINGDVPATTTLHNSGNSHLTYVASIFDVAHDHGLATCLYSGKSKFSVFANSYNAKHGAPDEVGEDNGCNKIDRVAIVETTDILVDMATSDLAGGACDFAFIHLADLDWQGHSLGWGSEGWLSALDNVDRWIGQFAAFADPAKTDAPFALVVTADHGGTDFQHSDNTLPIDYTVPFFLVGQDVPPGIDLYALAGADRADPGTARIRFSAPRQPVRNADAANVIAAQLGLPPVPGSFMRGLWE